MAMKENRTQFTMEDTLRTVKESIHDSMFESSKTLVRLLDKICDKLVNVVDYFKGNNLQKIGTEIDQIVDVETIQEIITGIETAIEGTVETITGIEAEMTVEM